MNNPQVLAFVRNIQRPRSELLRAVKALIDSDLQTWMAISALVPNTSQLVDDGQQDEGASRLTCADIHNTAALLTNLKNRFDQAGVAAVIEKPCVRPLEVTLNR